MACVDPDARPNAALGRGPAGSDSGPALLGQAGDTGKRSLHVDSLWSACVATAAAAAVAAADVSAGRPFCVTSG
jgi:hypothetical protein